MKDLYHYFGNDLTISASGDVLGIDDTEKGQQRILRRLLTNPGDYIWHPDYGAGLPKYVGSVSGIEKIRALIRGQMLLESCVSKTPAPVIDVQSITGGINARIQYNDSTAGTTQTLSFDVSI